MMSSDLPPAPNLAHLKKQAKDLLREYRQRNAAAKLADAQRAIAREYGFPSWAKLKKHVEVAGNQTPDTVEQFKEAIQADDAARVGNLIDQHPALKTKIREIEFGFGTPPILFAAQRGRRDMIDVLLRAGADINARSKWWAGGFGVLDWANPELAAFLIQHGAKVDVHAAAHLGMLDKLNELVSADPNCVHARGGDGKTPLHCAGTIEAAQFLLDHGADINALDIDHESTPAQYMVGERPEIARYLISRGCKTDILMASALGELDLVRRLLDADPDCIRTRVSEEYFPVANANAGGTIYHWQLGWFVSAHQVARRNHHRAVFRLLMKRTPPEEKLLVACWIHNESLVAEVLKEDSNLAAKLCPAGRKQIAHAARNNNLIAVRLMLSAGLPLDSRGQNGGTPLHWAAWHGSLEMVQAILPHNPPLEMLDNQFKATPLGWAIHGSESSWNRKSGDYPATIRALLQAGAKLPDKAAGTPVVREELRRNGVTEI